MKKITRWLKRMKNKIYFTRKATISKNSFGIYNIALHALYHKDSEIDFVPNTGDIIIFVPELNYHVISTSKELIITNHDFPTLGDVETEVAERFALRAKEYISNKRLKIIEEILKNNLALTNKVKKKIVESSRTAILREKIIKDVTNNEKSESIVRV